MPLLELYFQMENKREKRIEKGRERERKKNKKKAHNLCIH